MSQRRLEVVGTGSVHSRLTITQTRITLKVAAGHASMRQVWTDAALAIAENINRIEPLRGELRTEYSWIWMTTPQRNVYFQYSLDGELMNRSDRT